MFSHVKLGFRVVRISEGLLGSVSVLFFFFGLGASGFEGGDLGLGRRVVESCRTRNTTASQEYF